MNQQPAKTTEVITKKAIIVGLILVIVNAYWVGIASELWYAAGLFSFRLFVHFIRKVAIRRSLGQRKVLD